MEHAACGCTFHKQSLRSLAKTTGIATFFYRHKVISADTKVRFAETKHEVMIMRQEEKKMQTQAIVGKRSAANLLKRP